MLNENVEFKILIKGKAISMKILNYKFQINTIKKY